MKHNEPLFSKALNVASRTFNDLDSLSDGSLHPPKNNEEPVEEDNPRLLKL